MARLTKKRRAYLRSEEAAEYRKLYSTTAWRKARLEHLTEHPLCVFCLALDRVVEARVVDHKTPHRGDLDLFWNPENWQSLCDTCHSATKQREEENGFSDAFDVDGYPIDPNHPANK